jgi:hypothetical protein
MHEHSNDYLHEALERILEGMDDPGPNNNTDRLADLIESTTLDTFLQETSLPSDEAWEFVKMLRSQPPAG